MDTVDPGRTGTILQQRWRNDGMSVEMRYQKTNRQVTQEPLH